MAVVKQEVNIGDMTAVPAIDMTRSLRRDRKKEKTKKVYIFSSVGENRIHADCLLWIENRGMRRGALFQNRPQWQEVSSHWNCTQH